MTATVGSAMPDLRAQAPLSPTTGPAPALPPNRTMSPGLSGQRVFTGDWLQDGCDCHTYTDGYIGEFVRHWNGWSVFRTDRAAAEAIVAEQQNLVIDQVAEHTSRGAHPADAWLATLRQSAFISWLGPLIVVDSRLITGDPTQVQITAPDTDNLYTIDWGWCWVTADSTDVHTIHGATHPAPPAPAGVRTGTGVAAPDLTMAPQHRQPVALAVSRVTEGHPVTTSQDHELIYSHPLLFQRQAHAGRWRVGYLAAKAEQPGHIRVSRAVAEHICHDLAQLRTETIQDAMAEDASYADALAEADATLPRLHLDGDRFIADWRHVHGDSGALVCTEPDPDGRYTIGAGLDWCQVTVGSCDDVRDDTTRIAALDACRGYLDCVSDPIAALLELADRARIAVAHIDRHACEAASRQLTDDEWDRLADHLGGYHEHVAGSDLNEAFLKQAFAVAGLEQRNGDPAMDTTTSAGHEDCGTGRTR